MEKIEIDWDIHKLIEAERKGFDEPPHLALRRLLKLPPPEPRQATAVEATPGSLPWTEDGVVAPHGSEARMEYLRGSQVYEGRFLNGRLVVNGQSFKTLSAAASALARTKEGGKTSLNGWLYWKAKFPGDRTWRSLKDMRDGTTRFQ